MTEKDALFNRILLILMIALYLLSLGAFLYAEWQASQQGGELWMIALNGLILSIPLVLFFGSIYVLVSAWRAHRSKGEIGARLSKVIHWVPRLAAVFFIFFLTLFSLDVFDMGGTVLQQLGAFVMHSLPSIALALLLAFAWRRPLIGFITFLLAGLFFLTFVIGGSNFGLLLLFTGPLLLISALFYADWRWLSPATPAPPGETGADSPAG